MDPSRGKGSIALVLNGHTINSSGRVDTSGHRSPATSSGALRNLNPNRVRLDAAFPCRKGQLTNFCFPAPKRITLSRRAETMRLVFAIY